MTPAEIRGAREKLYPLLSQTFRGLGYFAVDATRGATMPHVFARGAEGREAGVFLGAFGPSSTPVARFTITRPSPLLPVEITAHVQELEELARWIPGAVDASPGAPLPPLPLAEHRAATWGPEYRWTVAARAAWSTSEGGAS